jgi:hypothetical protein
MRILRNDFRVHDRGPFPTPGGRSRTAARMISSPIAAPITVSDPRSNRRDTIGRALRSDPSASPSA